MNKYPTPIFWINV